MAAIRLSNRRRRRRSRRRGRRRNPLVLTNRRHRRRRGRRARRRGRRGRRRRNPFNVGGIVGRARSALGRVTSRGTLTQAAGIVAGMALSWYLPARFAPQYQTGPLQSAGLSALAGVVASAVVGAFAPAWAGVVFLGGMVGAAWTVASTYILPQIGMAGGMGDFLTLRNPMPRGLIAGHGSGGRMGDFLETRQPYSQLGAAGGPYMSSLS